MPTMMRIFGFAVVHAHCKPQQIQHFAC